MSSEATHFSGIVVEGSKATKAAVLNITSTKKYAAARTSEWTEAITTETVEKMKAISPHFKYIVSCVIIQKYGAGVHMETAVHWDSKSDGDFVVREENDTMVIVVTVYGLAL